MGRSCDEMEHMMGRSCDGVEHMMGRSCDGMETIIKGCGDDGMGHRASVGLTKHLSLQKVLNLKGVLSSSDKKTPWDLVNMPPATVAVTVTGPGKRNFIQKFRSSRPFFSWC